MHIFCHLSSLLVKINILFSQKIKLIEHYYYSNGSGITGLFIAFDRLLQEATQGHEINVYQSVHIIREQRPNMVANLVCYLALQVNLIKYLTNYYSHLLHITYFVFHLFMLYFN